MADDSRKMLEAILTTQVLLLAREIRREKAEHGTITTSDCIQEAANLIRRKHDDVLRALRGAR